MIDWKAIKAQLGAIIADISELGPEHVRWMDESQGSEWHVEPSIFLRLKTTKRQGIEEERRTDVEIEVDDETKVVDQVVEMVGQRQFTLSIRVESFDQDVASERFAGNVVDRIAIRLMRSTTKERLTSCAIETREATQFLDYLSGGRRVSCYVLDVQMRTIDIDRDKTAAAGSFIERVEGEGTIAADGTEVDVSIAASLEVNPF